MDSLKKLHKLLKEDQSLREFIALVEKISPIIATKSPLEFALSSEHQMLCDQLQKMKLNLVEQAFKELPPIPEITAIILKASKEFTLAFLMIPANRCFGWHDHANMNGISKCTSGELSIRSLNPLHLTLSQLEGPNIYYYPVERLREETLSPRGQKISIIYPDSYNIHEIRASQQSSFIDLLMPEYPDNSCHYYKTVEGSAMGEDDQKLRLLKVYEPEEQVFGLESLVKALRLHEKQKLNPK